jgi:hypothetical protein
MFLKKKKPSVLVSPGSLCPFCIQGTLELGTKEKDYQFPSGNVVTNIPYLKCTNCSHEGLDLVLLVEIQRKLATWEKSTALPRSLPFVHFGIAIPLPEQRIAS